MGGSRAALWGAADSFHCLFQVTNILLSVSGISIAIHCSFEPLYFMNFFPIEKRVPISENCKCCRSGGSMKFSLRTLGTEQYISYISVVIFNYVKINSLKKV